MTKTKPRLSALLRARRTDELEDRRQRTIYLLWNAAALLLSSLGIAVLSLALAIGTYDVEEFFGYFSHPVLLLLNWLPILLLQLLFFCLFGRHWAAFLATAVLIFLPSAGDFYKIKFRFEPFTFEDMDSVAAGRGRLSADAQQPGPGLPAVYRSGHCGAAACGAAPPRKGPAPGDRTSGHALRRSPVVRRLCR